MTTDIFGNAIFTNNQKEILELANNELRAQLSEERGYKVNFITISVEADRRSINYSYSDTFTIDPREFIEVEIVSGHCIEKIEGRDAEAIYSRYLDLVSKYSMKFKNSLVCRSLL